MIPLKKSLLAFFQDNEAGHQPVSSRVAPEYGVEMTLGPMVDDQREEAAFHEWMAAAPSSAPDNTRPPISPPDTRAYEAAIAETSEVTQANPAQAALLEVVVSRTTTVLAMRRYHQLAVAQATKKRRSVWGNMLLGKKEMDAAS